MIKIIKLDTYIDLVASLEQYKSLLKIERKISAKQEEQIEKMKNCENCKLYDCTVDCIHTKCKYQYSEMCRDENMIDKWELSE